MTVCVCVVFCCVCCFFVCFFSYGLKLNCESWEDAMVLVCRESNSVLRVSDPIRSHREPGTVTSSWRSCKNLRRSRGLRVSPTWFSCRNERWTRTKCFSLNVPQLWVGLDPDQDLSFLCLRLVSN